MNPAARLQLIRRSTAKKQTLVADLLRARDTSHVRELISAVPPSRYNGFHLVFADALVQSGKSAIGVYRSRAAAGDAYDSPEVEDVR